MKALMSVKTGGPETLELLELETPVPGKGQVLINVKAAGVNFPDTLIIRDLYQFKPQRPFSPGGEVAGIVEQVGEGVDHVSVGDRVLSGAPFGGYASHMVAPGLATHKIPDNMPFEDAAAFLMTFVTSHHALVDRARLKKGETLFILGASGGVGIAAIQLGKAFGARVVAAVSSEDKADFCLQAGADDVLVYPKGELDQSQQKQLSNDIKAKCGKDGADVIYDAVGGDYAEPALRAIAWEGRYLVVGFTAGIPKLPLNLTLLKGCEIVGVFWGGHLMKKPKESLKNVKDLFDLYSKGLIKPQISGVYALEDAAKALVQIENRTAKGKLVLKVD